MSGRRISPALAACALALLALSAASCARRASVTAPATETGSLAPVLAAAPGARTIPDAYIVVYRRAAAALGSSITDELVGRLGLVTQQRYSHALPGFAATLTPTALAAVRRDPRVEWVEPDQVVQASVTQANPPNWGLDRIDQAELPLSHGYKVNQTGAGVDAYIIDTGIRLAHSDFGGRAVLGMDAIKTSNKGADGNGHGTHVASTVGGTTFGVAKKVRLIAVRVLDASGSGSMSGVIAGVDWVTANHTTRPAVANMSLGGGASPALDQAVRNSIADGIVYCVAAGNSAVDAANSSPARVSEAITVAASNSADQFAGFSNFGNGVDLIAPGVGITAAWYTTNTATNTISGTSMATPHVAGTAALYLEMNPGSTPAQVANGLVTLARANAITGVPGSTPNLLLQGVMGTPPPPAVPALTSPKANATNQSRTVKLSWAAAAEASSYRLQVATDASFSTLVYNDTGGATAVTMPQLPGATKHWWRVNASNADGTSAWSEVRAFTTKR